MKKGKEALEMFLYFFRIGWFTFGGGWSIVAQMQKDYVDDRKEITSEELLDLISVGRSLPGTMVGNVAYLFGYHKAGVLGGVAALLGIAAPPFIILSVLTFAYTMMRDNIWVAKALVGVRAAVCPIILSAAIQLSKSAYPYKICYLVTVIAGILSFVWNISCIYIVIFGLVAGLLISRLEEQKHDN